MSITYTAISLFVLVNTLLILLFGFIRKSGYFSRLGLFYLSLLSLFVYANFGNPFTLLPTKLGSVTITPAEQNRPFFNPHDLFHTYMASKYFPEVGYFSLYDAAVLADAESPSSSLTTRHVRNLRAPLIDLSIEESKNNALLHTRPRFTEERWKAFKEDLFLLRQNTYEGWLDYAVSDFGYDLPPVWMMINRGVAQALSLHGAALPGSDLMETSHLLILLDVFILLLCGFFLLHSFGLVGFSLFFIIFGTSYISHSAWTGGSFMRDIWLFGVVGGICFLKNGRYFLSGIMLGLAASLIIFPVLFIIGAAVSLLFHYFGNRSYLSSLKRFLFGAFISLLLLIPASISQFGSKAWVDYIDVLDSRQNLFFVPHIGYSKVAVYDEDITGRVFASKGAIENFALWTNDLLTRAEKQQPQQMGIFALCMLVFFRAASRIYPHESALLFGTLVMYLLFMPPNYYFGFLALIPPIIFHQMSGGWRSAALSTAFLFFWMATASAPHIWPDAITRNYYISLGMGSYLLLWLMLRTLQKNPVLAESDATFELDEIEALIKKTEKESSEPTEEEKPFGEISYESRNPVETLEESQITSPLPVAAPPPAPVPTLNATPVPATAAIPSSPATVPTPAPAPTVIMPAPAAHPAVPEIAAVPKTRLVRLSAYTKPPALAVPASLHPWLVRLSAYTKPPMLNIPSSLQPAPQEKKVPPVPPEKAAENSKTAPPAKKESKPAVKKKKMPEKKKAAKKRPEEKEEKTAQKPPAELPSPVQKDMPEKKAPPKKKKDNQQTTKEKDAAPDNTSASSILATYNPATSQRKGRLKKDK